MWLILILKVVLVVKNPPASARDSGSIPGSGRSPGEGNGNPLQYPCLENSMDRGTWRATVNGVTKSWTRLSDQAHIPHSNGSSLETHYPIQKADLHFTKAFSRHIILFQSKGRLLILKSRDHIKTGRMI